MTDATLPTETGEGALRFHESADAAEALLYAASLVEYGDLDELALPREELTKCDGNKEARGRVLVAHALRQLAAGGLPKRVWNLPPDASPSHLARPRFREAETVSSDSHPTFLCGEVLARTYDRDRGWIYDIYWNSIEAREASGRYAPWMAEADLKPVMEMAP